MKLKALIKHLDKNKTDYHADEVEYVIVRKADGAIVTMELAGSAVHLAKLLKRFKTD